MPIADSINSILTSTANSGDYTGLISVTLMVLISGWKLLSPASTSSRDEQVLDKKTTQKEQLDVSSHKTISFSDRLIKGLSKSREQVWGKLEKLISSGPLSKDQLDEIEELLYSADIGGATVLEIIDELEKRIDKGGFSLPELKEYLFHLLSEKMRPVQSKIKKTLTTTGPQVYMIVGINGAGKTTTIGKLATKLTQQGSKVVVGACDTFRAAAVDQLQVWCERSGALMVRAKDGADPSGVAYEALKRAKEENADYCLLDTAGRLHTKENLMEELKKNKRVLAKLDESAPHEVFLVIDAITGQNAMRQAEEFHKALGLTGLVFTKCDGSSKAGHAVSIVQNLQVPIQYIGVGEGVEDLDLFNLDNYLNALLDIKQNEEVTTC